MVGSPRCPSCEHVTVELFGRECCPNIECERYDGPGTRAPVTQLPTYIEPFPALRSSADCANGHHSQCSGSRYIGERDGHPQYGRCRCRCHG